MQEDVREEIREREHKRDRIHMGAMEWVTLAIRLRQLLELPFMCFAVFTLSFVIFGSESVCIMTVCTCDHIHLCEKWTDFGVVEVNVCRVLFFGCYKVLSLDSKLYIISVY